MATQPLTLTDLFGEEILLHDIVEDVYGDGLELMIGHIGAAEAQRRIENQPWYTPRLLVAHIEHAHVRFDRHAAGCDHPGTIRLAMGEQCPSPRCSWEPWIRYHWHQVDPTHPDALAVTFAELDDVPTLITPGAPDRQEEEAMAA